MFQPVPQVLQHASYLPPQPATATAGMDPNSPIYEELTVQIGEGPTYSITGTGQPLSAFIFAVSALGAVDETGKNPLTVAFNAAIDELSFRSSARLRLGGNFADFYLLGPQDIQPTPGRVFDTDTPSVRHGDTSLAAHLHAVDARYLDLGQVVVGLRRHGWEDPLVTKGASIGNSLSIYHGDRAATFTVDSWSTIGSFIEWLNGSPELNPTGLYSHLRADLDQHFGNVRVTSVVRDAISIEGALYGNTVFDALFGSLPA